MIELPSNHSYNVVLIIIDKLTKKKHYIPYIIDTNSTTVEAITYLLLNNI